MVISNRVDYVSYHVPE